MYKPQVLFFYTNDCALERLTSEFPLCIEDAVYTKRTNQNTQIIDYEHYTLKCFKVNGIGFDFARGLKGTKVIVERELYNKINNDGEMRLSCMIVPNILSCYKIQIF